LSRSPNSPGARLECTGFWYEGAHPTFKKLAPLIRQKFMQYKGTNQLKAATESYHLEALGFSDEVVQALLNIEPGELEQLLKGYESGKTASTYQRPIKGSGLTSTPLWTRRVGLSPLPLSGS
jgi:hypothetical protein